MYITNINYVSYVHSVPVIYAISEFLYPFYNICDIIWPPGQSSRGFGGAALQIEIKGLITAW